MTWHVVLRGIAGTKFVPVCGLLKKRFSRDSVSRMTSLPSQKFLHVESYEIQETPSTPCAHCRSDEYAVLNNLKT